MNKINKILTIAICLSAACALAGCGSSNKNASSTEQTEKTAAAGEFESVNDSDVGKDSETVDDSALVGRKETTEDKNSEGGSTGNESDSSDNENGQSDKESSNEYSNESVSESESDNGTSAEGVYQFSTYQVTVSDSWTVESSTDVGINLNAPSGGLMEIGTLNTSRSAEGWAEFVADYTGAADAEINTVSIGNYEYYTFSTGEDAYYFTEKESNDLKTILQIHTNGINSDNAAGQLGMIEIY